MESIIYLLCVSFTAWQSCNIDEEAVEDAISQCSVLETLDVRFCPKVRIFKKRIIFFRGDLKYTIPFNSKNLWCWIVADMPTEYREVTSCMSRPETHLQQPSTCMMGWDVKCCEFVGFIGSNWYCISSFSQFLFLFF